MVQTATVAKDSNSTKLASELVSSEVPRGAWENAFLENLICTKHSSFTTEHILVNACIEKRHLLDTLALRERRFSVTNLKLENFCQCFDSMVFIRMNKKQLIAMQCERSARIVSSKALIHV